jgi:hypothetical protein
MAIMNSAVREVQVYLENEDVLSALDTVDKIKALQVYFLAMYRKKKARLIYQNIAADSHIRSVREIGHWLEGVIPHGGDRKSTSLNNEDDIKLRDLGITWNQSSQWQTVSRIPDIEYRRWAAPYMNGGVERGMELNFYKLWEHIKPKAEKPQKAKIEAPIALSPALTAAYKATKEWKVAMTAILEEVAVGDIPREQIVFVFEQMKDMPAILVKVMKEVGELY